MIDPKQTVWQLSKSNPAIWLALFAALYIAVLSMANTIALRNVVLLAMVLILATRFMDIRSDLWLGVPVLAWAGYLLVFPFISADHGLAWSNFIAQWGRGLLALMVGAGVASLMSRRAVGSTFFLGLMSAVPILVHLVLIALKSWDLGAIPWGDWGRETHHADLGYAAGVATMFLSAHIICAGDKSRIWAVALIVAALLSMAIARSRAGLVFAVFGAGLVFLVAYLSLGTQRRYTIFAGFAALLFLAGTAVVGVASKDDPRWSTMASQITAGFLGDAIQIECEGTASIEDDILTIYGVGPKAQGIIQSVRDGDGARMVVLRAGLQMALKHPWGSDGSRQAFRKLLLQECERPVLQTAHAHNAWVDTLLAIGWAGAVLYLIVLLGFLRLGLIHLRENTLTSEWALVLVAFSLFWIVRGFTDSVFRDHMLEMQGFALAYASVALKRANRG